MTAAATAATAAGSTTSTAPSKEVILLLLLLVVVVSFVPTRTSISASASASAASAALDAAPREVAFHRAIDSLHLYRSSGAFHFQPFHTPLRQQQPLQTLRDGAHEGPGKDTRHRHAPVADHADGSVVVLAVAE